MTENYGIVKYNGKTYTLKQSPYITLCGDYERYEALAEDAEGTEYIVQWNTTDEWDAEQAKPYEEREGWADDESCACDWENPVCAYEA